MIGLINIQYGVAGGELYVIEANPRASRTVPFVSKAIGTPLAKIACRLMLGEKLADQELPERAADHVSVKEAVLPFARFAGADSVLGPEMKSTGEVMGIAADFPTAFGKAQAAAGVSLPERGRGLHHRHRHRQAGGDPARDPLPRPRLRGDRDRRHRAGDLVDGRAGDAGSTRSARARPHVVDLIRERRCDLVINTPTGSGARADGYEIRTAAVRHGIPCVTTMTGASAAARAIAAQIEEDAEVRSLQEIHGAATAASPRGAGR